jgi:peptidylprolyl isomerase
MQPARLGDTVKIDYVGMLDDGTVFESTVDKLPLQFTLGSGEVIPGFDAAVVGMSPGEWKTCRIPTEKAFGPPQAEMVVVVDRSHVPDRVSLKIGDAVEVSNEYGQAVVAKVARISGSDLALDLNHPLAGQDLTVALKLIDIVEST